MDNPNKIHPIATLRRLYARDESVRRFIDWSASRNQNLLATTAEEAAEALGTSRSEMLRVFRALDELHLGEARVGRRKYPTRFMWSYTPYSVWRVARQETDELERTGPLELLNKRLVPRHASGEESECAPPRAEDLRVLTNTGLLYEMRPRAEHPSKVRAVIWAGDWHKVADPRPIQVFPGNPTPLELEFWAMGYKAGAEGVRGEMRKLLGAAPDAGPPSA